MGQRVLVVCMHHDVNSTAMGQQRVHVVCTHHDVNSTAMGQRVLVGCVYAP